MVFAQVQSEKFIVAGNCGMCESRIEKAAKSVTGIFKADWNKENKMIEVSFDAAEQFRLELNPHIFLFIYKNIYIQKQNKISDSLSGGRT